VKEYYYLLERKYNYLSAKIMENENKIHHQQDQDMTIQELNTNLLIKIMQFLYLDDGMRLCMTSSLFLEANKHTSCLWKLDQIPPRLLFDYNKNEEQKGGESEICAPHWVRFGRHQPALGSRSYSRASMVPQLFLNTLFVGGDSSTSSITSSISVPIRGRRWSRSAPHLVLQRLVPGVFADGVWKTDRVHTSLHLMRSR